MLRNFGGVFMGTALLQQTSEFGGARDVFVKLQGVKNDLVFPTFGGQLKNPFPGPAKIFAGDLFEVRTDKNGEKPELYLLKTYEVAKASSGTEIFIVRDGYRHIPFAGDILMKAPTAFGTEGAGYAVTAVEETTDSGKDVWKVTLATALGSLVEGDILVEAAESGASAKMLVQNINAVAPCDYDIFNMPSSGKTSDFDKTRYLMTPALHGTMYISKMSPVPEVALELNKSRINGWYEL